MTQGMPGEEALPVQASSTADKQLRLFQFLVAQDDGTFKNVVVEPTVLVDPDTASPYVAMTSAQADTMITLLTEIRDILRDTHEDMTE